MKKFLGLVIVFLILSCNNSTNEKSLSSNNTFKDSSEVSIENKSKEKKDKSIDEEVIKIKSTELPIKIIKDSILNCRTKSKQNKCSSLFINYFNIVSDQEFCKKINNEINSKVFKDYYSSSAKQEFFNMSSDFYFDSRTSINLVLNKANILSFVQSGAMYSQGGAGYMYSLSGGFNYDINKNKKISIQDIIQPSKMNSFYKKLNDKLIKLNFKMENIDLSGFSIKKEGIVLYHNQGFQIEVVLPFSSIQDELTLEWKEISEELI